MFKLKEQGLTRPILVDMSDLNKTYIEPGSILYMDTKGLRLAVHGDTMTATNAGKFYIANDYLQNSKITSIYGHPGAVPGYIAAANVLDTMEMEIEFDSALHRGDTLAIVDGAIVKSVPEILVEHMIFGKVLENNHDELGNIFEFTKVGTYVGHATEEANPMGFLIQSGRIDNAMDENTKDPEYAFNIINAMWNADTCEDLANWEIDTGTTDLTVTSISLARPSNLLTIYFNGLSKPGTITIQALREALLEINTGEPAEQASAVYPINIVATIPQLSLQISEIQAGWTVGSITVSVTNGTFDPTTMGDPDNWEIDATALGPDVVLGAISPLDVNGQHTAAIINFGSTGAQFVAGDVTIQALASAFIGTETNSNEITVPVYEYMDRFIQDTINPAYNVYSDSPTVTITAGGITGNYSIDTYDDANDELRLTYDSADVIPEGTYVDAIGTVSLFRMQVQTDFDGNVGVAGDPGEEITTFTGNVAPEDPLPRYIDQAVLGATLKLHWTDPIEGARSGIYRVDEMVMIEGGEYVARVIMSKTSGYQIANSMQCYVEYMEFSSTGTFIRQRVTLRVQENCNIRIGAASPTLFLELDGGTFSAACETITNWTVKPGTTALTLTSVGFETETSVALDFSGTAVEGELVIVAHPLAITDATEDTNPVYVTMA